MAGGHLGQVRQKHRRATAHRVALMRPECRKSAMSENPPAVVHFRPTRNFTETGLRGSLSIQCRDERHVVRAGLVCAQLGTSSLERHGTELRTARRKNGPQKAASAVSRITGESQRASSRSRKAQRILQVRARVSPRDSPFPEERLTGAHFAEITRIWIAIDNYRIATDVHVHHVARD